MEENEKCINYINVRIKVFKTKYETSYETSNIVKT